MYYKFVKWKRIHVRSPRWSSAADISSDAGNDENTDDANYDQTSTEKIDSQEERFNHFQSSVLALWVAADAGRAGVCECINSSKK